MTSEKKSAAAEWVDPSDLVPWRRNPRRLTEEDVLRIMRSIKRFGFGAPIVARRSDNAVIAGHARREAALRLGLERVPVRYLERDLSDAELESLLVADNRIGELRAWDETTLRELLDGLDDDLRDLACCDAVALDAIVEEINESTNSDNDTSSGETEILRDIEYRIVVEIKDEQTQRELYERLTSEGFQCRMLIS